MDIDTILNQWNDVESQFDALPPISDGNHWEPLDMVDLFDGLLEYVPINNVTDDILFREPEFNLHTFTDVDSLKPTGGTPYESQRSSLLGERSDYKDLAHSKQTKCKTELQWQSSANCSSKRHRRNTINNMENNSEERQPPIRYGTGKGKDINNLIKQLNPANPARPLKFKKIEEDSGKEKNGKRKRNKRAATA